MTSLVLMHWFCPKTHVLVDWLIAILYGHFLAYVYSQRKPCGCCNIANIISVDMLLKWSIAWSWHIFKVQFQKNLRSYCKDIQFLGFFQWCIKVFINGSCLAGFSETISVNQFHRSLFLFQFFATCFSLTHEIYSCFFSQLPMGPCCF